MIVALYARNRADVFTLVVGLGLREQRKTKKKGSSMLRDMYSGWETERSTLILSLLALHHHLKFISFRYFS
jgi:hypothetical protein